jgi:hypothetical protein
MPALMYSARVGVVPVRARLKILLARSRAAGGRAVAAEGVGDGGSMFGISEDATFWSGVAELGGAMAW